ncbi:MAG: peptide ABC transporter substrate-binding protein [Pyrinomonadaceae bacterium]
MSSAVYQAGGVDRLPEEKFMTKNRRRQQLRLGIFLTAVALIAAACTASAKNDQYFGKISPPAGQVLRYISGAEPQTLDPQYMTGQPESRIAVALFDGLVEYEETTMRPRPSLASSWEPNADGTVWTFHLRNDAKWTDGNPLNAHDFVYSWQRALSPELAAPYASLMYYLKNGQSYNEQSAYVRDPKTGRFATEEDLKRAGATEAVNFTGTQPVKYSDAPVVNAVGNSPQTSAPSSESTAANNSAAQPAEEKYLFVPSDADVRAKLLKGDPAKKKPGKPELARLVEGKEFVPVTKDYVGVRALDDYTFQVTLEAPTAFFVKMLYHQFFRPVPRQAIEKWGGTLWVKPEHLITSGAFKLTEWTPYERIIVERNPLFWDNANTKLDKIIFPATEQLTTAMNLYKAGEVDATQSNEVPPPWRNQLKATKKDYMYGPYLQVEYLAIKTSMPPFNDVRVRRAFNLAINRQILADQAPGRLPLTGYTPKMEGYENPPGEAYNPDEARRLLAEAGYPNGRGFPKFEILYNTAESNKQTQEFVQSMLKRELNVNVELTNQEWRVFLDNTKATKLNFKGLARHAWIGDFVDPHTFLELLTSDSDNNRTDWKDAKYDAMLKAANAEIDPEKRAKLLQATEAYAIKFQPLIPLFIGPSSFMLKPYVKNLVPNLLDQHDWRGVYIDHSQTGE